MVERHRGGGRGGDFGRGRDVGRPGREGREGREGRSSREGREGREGRDTRSDRGARGNQSFGSGSFGGGAPYRERRQLPAPTAATPAPDEQFEDVDASLAVAILDTAAHLTEIVGTAGLPEGYAERRQAVLETFEAVYYHVLETVTGGDEDNEE